MGGAVRRIDEQVARLDQSPTPSPTMTSTPLPTATPSLSRQQIEELIEARVAVALTAVPTPTVQPTPTPGLSLDQVEELIESRVNRAISAIPTPRPIPTPTPVSLPALVAVAPQVSGPSVTTIAGKVTLKVEPGQPLAGRDIAFALSGLKPWQSVEVEFVDPRWQPVEWVTDDEVHFARRNGSPVTRMTLYADEAGRASWLRIGTKDAEGVWSVRITLDDQTTAVSYPVSQLQLPVQQIEKVGVELRRFQGLVSDTYYSALVPATLAVDLQSHLAWVVEQLWERWGIQSSAIPDLHLLGNRAVLGDVSDAIGVDLGFEAGYFKPGGERPGIYMRTDFFRAEIQTILTHEYTHLVLDEAAGGPLLPTWLNEGIAEYVETELGLLGERPDIARRSLYVSAELTRSAAASGSILPLTSLESRSSWNAQRDERLIRLQYAEAHMSVRFLAEEHGPNAPIAVAKGIAGGMGLEDALRKVTNLSYQEFQDSFFAWLKSWEDPERSKVLQYVRELSKVMDSWDSISERREATLQDSHSARAPAVEAMVGDAQALHERLTALSHPASLSHLHDSALAFLSRAIEWLSLEQDYVKTGMDAKRSQANDMIPEIDARDILLWRSINDAQFTYQLD
jgi:hypothetical protein